MNTQKFLTFSWRSFFILFSVVYGWLFVNVLFGSYERTHLQPFLTAFMILFFVLPLVFGSYYVLTKIKIDAALGKKILIRSMIFYAIVHTVTGWWLVFTPTNDIAAVINSGARWVYRGEFPQEFAAYFAHSPNQMGGAFVYRIAFTIAHVLGIGYTDDISGPHGFVPAIVNIIGFQVLIFSLYFCAKEFCGVRGGVFALFLLFVFLPFMFMAAYTYTDAMAMPFGIGAYALFLHAKKIPGLTRKKLVLFGVVGLLFGLAAVIKLTMLVIPIAILIEFLLSDTREKAKTYICCVTAAAAAPVIFMLAFFAYFDSHLADETIERYRMPPAFWIVLGLTEDGYWHTAPTYISNYWTEHNDDFADYASRTAYVNKLFEERLAELDLFSFHDLFIRKAQLTFSDGQFQMSRLLNDTPVRPNILHGFLLGYDNFFDDNTSGSFQVWRHIVTSVSLSYLLIIIVGAVLNIKKKMISAVPSLVWFGLLIFTSLLEVGSRFLVVGIPFLIFGVVLVVDSMYARLCRR